MGIRFGIPQSASWKSTVPFSVPLKKGRVIKVYDGDTITIANYLPIWRSPLYRFSVRINGIDCPEIKGSCESEKTCAKIARDFLKKRILGKVVQLKNVRSEKYGRVLADVFYKKQSCGDLLVKNKLAVKYGGGKKVSPKDWMVYYNSS